MTFRRTFQIGLPHTGSRSVAAAIWYMGLKDEIKVIHSMPHENREECVRQYVINILAGTARISWFENYDYIGELSASLWKQIDNTWLGSRFILCIRPVESWKESRKTMLFPHRRHVDRPRSSRKRFAASDVMKQYHALDALINFGSLTYTDRWVDKYIQHNSEVVEHFKDRTDDFLLFNCFEGDSWNKLGSFLGLPVPPKEVPFPVIKSLRRPDAIANTARDLKTKYGMCSFND